MPSCNQLIYGDALCSHDASDVPQSISVCIELSDGKGSRVFVPFVVESDFFLNIGGADEKRSSRKSEMSCSVIPIVARSLRISPTIGANLKPWPQHGDATMIPGEFGKRSMIKVPSGVSVYMHVFAATSRPLAAGTNSAIADRMPASSSGVTSRSQLSGSIVGP